ncbi:aminodeoxychorismate/anthranilate synthase component II [Parenemella sanctibonifatiensis]|uniref:Aminodeoxychorismate/anthranilate synthase component II n=1 Tax=Parenemella sanctibonifatiensis TaxID=2016505 RepID=A0A255EIY6_9ACTN|nr:aminodeoxychorismate/anthranilate synthase component II [Parenemella sanctibonifatiensis]OYN91486.1 aminodeoxychorismate/anthranilate synthase component II [Parenemella sanctibonifatiensis]
MTRILVIDNYDSFVYNLVQYLAQLGAEVEVWRNDDERFEADQWWRGGADSLPFDGVLLSPGPGTPEAAGVCVRVVRQLEGQVPIFGVCLGLQAIAVAYGGVVDRAPELLHGKVSHITHDGQGVFRDVPSPVQVTRYHSLAMDPDHVPAELEVTAVTESGVVMAVRHRTASVEAVQFHPESVLTEHGYPMLGNWLAACGDAEAPARAAGLKPVVLG